MTYPAIVRDEGEHGWSAVFPDLRGCVAGADTWAELLPMMEDAERAWLDSARQHGDPIPEPGA